ncbi:MAG: PHP domain-containing protein [Candidatus Thorarchaeota archaeon]|nr:PHP domain-containing protein [Candidatus Thorarchaeota archaeon]
MQNTRYDLHIHSDYSDGKSSVHEIASRANTINLETAVVADHFWPSLGSCQGGKNIIENRRRDIETARLEFPSLAILEGVEVDIQSDGSLAPVAGGLEQFDIVIGSFHWVLDSYQWVSILSKVVKKKQFHVLGHWDGFLSSYREEDGDLAAQVLAETGIAIELNERYILEHTHFIERAKEYDCIFTLGSDSHSVETIGQLDYGKKIASDFDLNVVEPSYFLNRC